MAYTLFTDEKVFSNNNNNAVCNVLLDALTEEFTDAVVSSNFGLTGSVARIIQGAPNVPVLLVAFVTSSSSIFAYLNENIRGLVVSSGAVLFTDRIQVITTQFNLEIWFKPNVNFISVGGIVMEETSQIYTYIL